MVEVQSEKSGFGESMKSDRHKRDVSKIRNFGLNNGNAEIKPYPSGVNIIRNDGIDIHIDIQFLGRMVAKWRKSNPDIDFEAYT